MLSTTAQKYLKLLEPLSVEVKLELLSGLYKSLENNFQVVSEKKENDLARRTKLMYELAGAWSDMDENLVEEIIASRTTSGEDINFDD